MSGAGSDAFRNETNSGTEVRSWLFPAEVGLYLKSIELKEHGLKLNLLLAPCLILV